METEVDSKSDFEHERKTESVSHGSYGASSSLAVILNYWRDFDLENARGMLDEQGLKIAEHQENSQKKRRKLAEITRDFKKADTEEKAKLFGNILKAYQEEVDNLTKRAKFGENSFLNVYQKLYEAPDPVPALASAAEISFQWGEAEQENRKMKQELEEFRAEAAHLKNQQATVRRLEERNRHLEMQMEEKVKEMVEMKQKAMMEDNQKSLESLKYKEVNLQEQLQTARESVQNMQRLHDLGQSQLFDLRAQSEEEKAYKQSEVRLLTDEVERASARLTALEREKEALKAQLLSVQRQEVALQERADMDETMVVEAALVAKERIILDLHADMRGLEALLESERDQHRSEMKKLRSELEEKEASISQLEGALSVRPTTKQVMDLRKQIKMLQAVGYNLVELDEEGWEEAGPAQGDMGKLERLLLDKNRKMEHELTHLKVQLGEKERVEVESGKQRDRLEHALQEQRQLIARLEEDIVKGYGQRPTRASNWDAQDEGIVDLLQARPKQKVAQSGSVGEEEEEEHTMLAVVCGQRDRFRGKILELEEELRRSRDSAKGLSAELDRCKSDNVKLYEKIRYVQEYSHGRPRKRDEDLEAGSAASDVEQRYRKLYEDNINPFAAFSSREKEARYKELGLRERITLSSGRFLLANKYARGFVFFYSIALHLLVFGALYTLALHSHYGAKQEMLPSKRYLLNIGKFNTSSPASAQPL